jgi:hypothetical protein
MKVSSPIGDLPFEPRALHFRRGRIEVDGVMGAWPAHVEITASDLPALARLAARPAAVIALSAITVLGLARLARPSRQRH